MSFQMKPLLIVGIFSIFCVVLGTDNENARLLASKTILNQFLVEDKDLTVQYDIYNVGARLDQSEGHLYINQFKAAVLKHACIC